MRHVTTRAPNAGAQRSSHSKPAPPHNNNAYRGELLQVPLLRGERLVVRQAALFAEFALPVARAVERRLGQVLLVVAQRLARAAHDEKVLGLARVRRQARARRVLLLEQERHLLCFC